MRTRASALWRRACISTYRKCLPQTSSWRVASTLCLAPRSAVEEKPKKGTQGVFFCYRLPAWDNKEEVEHSGRCDPVVPFTRSTLKR